MRKCAAILLLLLAALAVALAFPPLHWLLKTLTANIVLWGLLIAFLVITLRALYQKRWISALFHMGGLALIVGGAITAGWAKESTLNLVDFAYADITQRSAMVGGEQVSLKTFRVEKYPNGMPRQYCTELLFDDGTYELSVNRPLRRKGYAYYQMSYGVWGQDYDGSPIYFTSLLIRHDPGVKIVFIGYGLLTLAALLMALREIRQ
ncbi:MAG: cytochrome c biogenesis protein ResB [Kiritimatiellia bacterium]